MNKSDLVSKLLEKGHLISPVILDQLSDEKINSIQPNQNTIVLKSFEESETSFSITTQNIKSSATVKSITEYYNKKYNIIKDILTTKLKPISINKLQQLKGQETIVGIVSGKGSFVIEDTTGRVDAKFLGDTKLLQENSILGFSGEFRGKTFLISSVYYPDIPLTKQIPKINFSMTLKKENNSIKILVNSEKEISITQTPATISIKKESKINILVYEPSENIIKNQATDALKLRYLPEPKIPTENYIISEEPDIFWVVQKDQWTENYKGVMIVSGEDVRI